jgi:hypothetical protein
MRRQIIASASNFKQLTVASNSTFSWEKFTRMIRYFCSPTRSQLSIVGYCDTVSFRDISIYNWSAIARQNLL